jgi:excinuclease ABC subunit C
MTRIIASHSRTSPVYEKEYAETVKNIKLFFEGRKTEVARRLERGMKEHAARLEFEQAGEYKKMLFALRHIKDVSLLDEDIRAASQRSSKKRARAYRIEAYDVAHISGKYTVGVMVVVEDGRPKKSDYRKFKIRIDPDRSDDPLHLEEVLKRRFGHPEWQRPDMLVIDGGIPQKRRAEKTMKELGIEVDIVSVVKDERHKPKAILGNKELIESYKHGILIGNGESHRFAVAYHRALRDRIKR